MNMLCHTFMLGRELTLPWSCCKQQLLGIRFMMSLRTGAPDATEAGFGTPNMPFNSGVPLTRCTSSKGCQTQMPLLTSSRASFIFSPIQTWTFPGILAFPISGCSITQSWGFSKKYLEDSPTHSKASMTPPWPTGGNEGSICSRLSWWHTCTSSPPYPTRFDAISFPTSSNVVSTHGSLRHRLKMAARRFSAAACSSLVHGPSMRTASDP